MTVRIRTIEYQEDATTLSGEFAWDDAWTTPRPAVVIVHDAMKSTGSFEEGRAATLAGRGYAGFVLDLYGKGVHGRDDPFVPAETVPAFAREMNERKADWQLVAYGNTLHGFTKPSANQPEIGAVYDEKADRRSWQSLQNFLAEIFR